MIIKKVDIRLLIPIRGKINPKIVKRLLKEYDSRFHRPIAVIEYEGGYLMGDGHHRACYFHLKKEKPEIEILKNDKDIAHCYQGEFDLRTNKTDFISDYENKYKPLCEDEGVKSIADLVRIYSLEDLL